MIKLHVHGIGPAFVRELVEAGYDDLGVDDLVQIKVRGTLDTLVRVRRQS